MKPTVSLRRIDLRGTPDPSVIALADRLLDRSATPRRDVTAAVRDILATIRAEGAPAVRAANARYGGGTATGRLLIGSNELLRAADALARPIRDALEHAARNIRAFAVGQRPASSIVGIGPGISIERRWVPVKRAGAYVPGGTAAYPSSLLMTVIPAKVAGVEQVYVASPAGPDGELDPVVLGAAGLLGVDGIVAAGGAQAVGALAFGLADESFERVDLIVGPGNAWVTAAKLEVVGSVGIDLPAGPSEGMVVAASESSAELVAADLLTQAEHGVDSPAILVTTSAELASQVDMALDRRLAVSPRRAILEQSLGEHGVVVLVDDLEAAIKFINAYAPEHLSIDLEPNDLAESVAGRIRNAGSVFVGPWAPESAGDYATGANHVLPTGGLARACGALAVETFGKYIQVQRVDRQGLLELRPTIVALAESEGMFAHRDAVEARFPAEMGAALVAPVGSGAQSRGLGSPDPARDVDTGVAR